MVPIQLQSEEPEICPESLSGRGYRGPKSRRSPDVTVVVVIRNPGDGLEWSGSTGSEVREESWYFGVVFVRNPTQGPYV